MNFSEQDINDRVSDLIKSLGLSQNGFGDSIGASSSRVSNICKKRNKPDSDFLAAILIKYKNVSGRWLLTGEGEMFVHLNKDEDVHLPEKVTHNSHIKTVDITHNIAAESEMEYGDEVQNLRKQVETLRIKNEALLEAFERVGGNIPRK